MAAFFVASLSMCQTGKKSQQQIQRRKQKNNENWKTQKIKICIVKFQPSSDYWKCDKNSGAASQKNEGKTENHFFFDVKSDKWEFKKNKQKNVKKRRTHFAFCFRSKLSFT